MHREGDRSEPVATLSYVSCNASVRGRAQRNLRASDVDRALYFRDDEHVLLELTRVEHYDVVAAQVDHR